MKSFTCSALFVFVVFSLLFLGCGSDNPAIDLDDPETFAGNYKLISFTAIEGNGFPAGTVIDADEETTLTIDGETATFTLSGTMALTETRFTIILTIAFSAPTVFTDTETDTGTFTLNGSTLTLNFDGGGSQVLTVSVDGNRLTIEDESIRLVFEKE